MQDRTDVAGIIGMARQNVPFLDLAAINRRYADKLKQAMGETIDSGWMILGEQVEAFEIEFATCCSARHAVGVGTGLDALALMLRAQMELGRLKPGDEVIVPANTYIATVLAISGCGLVPALAEPEAATFNLSHEQALNAASDQTTAILAVHLYGRMAPMRQLYDLCRERGWILMSDAAQAAGVAPLEGEAWGACAGFSFYPAKNLGALGDGGAVVTDDEEIADIVRAMRNYGSRKKYENEYSGVNSRLDEIQAAMLRVKLHGLAADNQHRSKIAVRYSAEIANPSVVLPQAPTDLGEHVWHLYVVRCPRRDELQRHLEACGIETLIHYPIPPHKQRAFDGKAFAQADLTLTEQLAKEVLSLPIGPTLTDDQASRVIDAVNSFGR